MLICYICNYKNTKYFHKIKNFSYNLCSRCLTLFLSSLPTQKQISSYYSKDFVYSAGESNEKNVRKRAKNILFSLKKLNPGGKTLLDIGSGYGYFIDEAAKRGFNIIGIEPSKSIYSTSVKRLIEVNIKNLDFEKYFKKNKNKKFDFVTLIHTIEHLINPKETIEKAIKLLNSCGILYIETPNLDSHLFRAEKYNYTFLTPPDHIWIFSQKSFKYMLKQISEITILKTSTYSYSEHFMGIIKTNLKSQNSNLKTSSDLNIKNDLNKTFSNFENWDLKLDWKLGFGNWKFFKYILFDKLLSPLLTPLLNLDNKGSILELYIRKK